jgi:hypothetical protein
MSFAGAGWWGFQHKVIMAELSENDRFAVWLQWMRENKEAITGAMTKAELRAAVDAMDTWANDNASALNSAIPQPARGALSASQKAALFSFVIFRRYGAGV